MTPSVSLGSSVWTVSTRHPPSARTCTASANWYSSSALASPRRVFGIFFALALVSFAFVYALAPKTKGRPLEAIRGYWYNGGRWPEDSRT